MSQKTHHQDQEFDAPALLYSIMSIAYGLWAWAPEQPGAQEMR